MKYLVIGAGGTGGCIGGFLAHGGQDVTLIARGEHLKAIQENGLHLMSSKLGNNMIKINACDADSYNDTPDVVFVCVKSYDLESIVPLIKRVCTEKTIIVPILNVLSAGEMLRDKTGFDVLDGCVYVVAHIESPGTVIQEGPLFRVVRGQKNNENSVEIYNMAKELEACKIRCIVSENIKRDCLRKFSMVSPLAAAESFYDCSAGGLKEGQRLSMFKNCVREVMEMAAHMGYILPEDTIEKNVKSLMMLDDNSYASTVRDLNAGKKSETNHIIFDVARYGREHKLNFANYYMVSGNLGFAFDSAPEYDLSLFKS